MAAQREDIMQWFKDGVAEGKAFWCDTWDWSDFPEYCDAETAQHQLDQGHGGELQAMEVYDLREDMIAQINMPRCWALMPR